MAENRNLKKTSEYAWEHFLNTTDDIVFFKDKASVYIAVSRSFARIVGKEKMEDIIGKSEFDIFPEEYAERYVKSDESLINGEENTITDITPLTFPDGSKGHMLISKSVFRDINGNICGICGIGHGFAENGSKETGRESAKACIFDYNIEEDVFHIQINSGKESRNLSYDNYRKIAGTSDMVHPDSREKIKENLEKAITEGHSGSFDIVCNVFGTGFTWHCVYYKTLIDSKGNPFRVIGQINNVQEEKKRELLINDLAGQMMKKARGISYDPDIVSSVFSLMYDSSDIEKTAQSILELIGTYYGVSRAYIFENHESQLYCSNTFEWCAEGIEPQKDAMQKYEYVFEDGRNVYIDNFNSEGVFLCRNIHELRDDQADILKSQNVYSMLQCAMYDNGKFDGFVGFDECYHERVWTGEQIGTLRIVSRLLGVFLEKRHHSADAAFTADFMLALDQNASFLYIVEPESHDIIFTNQVVKDVFGKDLVGKKCHKALLGNDEPCKNCPMRLYYETGKPCATEIMFPDGMWVLAQASPMHWQGRYMMMVSSTDITRHMSATEELRVRNEEYSIVINQSGKHIFRYDIPTTRINRFYDSSLVYGQRERVPNTPLGIVSQGLISADTVDDYMHFFNSMAEQIPEGSCDVQILQGDGSYRWFHYDYTLVDNPDGKSVSAIVSIGDVDAETKAAIELTRRAERDGMTGLYNKLATEEIAKRVVSRNNSESCAMIVIDLDDLKTINDTLGHSEGDNAINSIASAIRDHFRNTDIVGRIGGDEFMVLLHGAISESVLRSNLSSLVRKVSHKKIGQGTRNISCSIGASMGTCGVSDYETLFNHADTALYHIKRGGKCGFAIYSHEMESEDYSFSRNNRMSLNKTEWFESAELGKLFAAISELYPLVISVNLTKNSYYMMEYDRFKAQSCPDTGSFDELIAGGASTYHPDDRQSFLNAFSRDRQLIAHKSGKRTITHTGRQLGDDGVFRLTKTVVVFVEDSSGDICQMTFSKTL